jgi:hypothetical protein
MLLRISRICGLRAALRGAAPRLELGAAAGELDKLRDMPLPSVIIEAGEHVAVCGCCTFSTLVTTTMRLGRDGAP